MNTLSWMVDDSFSTRLTVSLLHFLWQGCCVGLVVWICGPLLSGATARVRYALNVTSLLVMAACLPVNFLLVGSPDTVTTGPWASQTGHDTQSPLTTTTTSTAHPSEQDNPIVSEPIRANEPWVARHPAAEMIGGPPETGSSRVTPAEWVSTLRSVRTANTFPALSRWIVALYLAGVACILGRLVCGVWGGHRLRRMALRIEDEALLASFRKLAYRVGLKVVPAVAWCEQISIPVVVGIVKPMILLPMAVVGNLTPDQLQALLLHELSHIRRYDPIVNLLQRIAEAILFFHPVVWFVSRRISIERELAADDMVLAAGWDRPLYADALLRMAELAAAFSGRREANRAAILAATGVHPSEFKLRILRLLDASRPPKFALSRTGILLVLSFLFVGGVFAWSQTQLRDATGDPPETAAADPIPRPEQQPSPTDREPREENTVLAKGLEFLKAYPALHGLSLDMTEQQCLEIVKQQNLKSTKTGEVDRTQYHIALGDGHVLIVMFDKSSGKCRGIQRVRGDGDETKVTEVTTGTLAFGVAAGGKPAAQGPLDKSGAAPPKERPNYVKVTGQLLDADTGKPIEKASWECGMASLEKPKEVAWGHSKTMGGSLPDGRFEQLVHFTPDGRFDRLRVYAAGYETTLVIDDLPNPRPLQVERIVRLKRGQTITGTLRDHTGKPVANGWVFFIPVGHSSNIVEGVPGTDAYTLPDKPRDGAVAEARTDTQGQFVLPAGSAGTLAASTDAVDLWPFELPDDGQADLTMPEPAHLVIDLTYWYLDDLVKKEKRAVSPNSEDPNQCWIQVDRHGDSKGLWKSFGYRRQMFVFALDPREKLSKGVSIGPVIEGGWEKPIPGAGHNKNTTTTIRIALPPGSYRVQRLKSGPFAPVDEQNVELKTGADTLLHWSRCDGAAVLGKVSWPANLLFVRQEGAAPRKLDWTVPNTATVTISNAEGKSIEAAKIQTDGRFFVATHLEPGKYKATATVYLPENDFRGGYRGPDCVATREFVIPEPLQAPSGSPPAKVELTMEASGSRFVPAPTNPADR